MQHGLMITKDNTGWTNDYSKAKNPYFTGRMCYSLRCSFLHYGTLQKIQLIRAGAYILPLVGYLIGTEKSVTYAFLTKIKICYVEYCLA
ncbi:hypothetical protein [Metabacillus bambusae]|uniref:Uncharacterized protein n=1 Tax=Metabacillus bambusae TaxID=2795218 RepID=A0ABS3MYX5_9BACI|nr:hypothetical protein [Metabacillus bambusae]MBO1511231.1 hypothetical protein [Metabacillus bambusae]